MSLFRDTHGKLSSKRIIGTSLVSLSVVMGVVLFYYALGLGVKEASVAERVIDMFLMWGCSLLGVSVIEKFGKK